MTSEPRKQEFWCDELRGKHECGPYTNPASTEISHQGRRLTLLSPFALNSSEIASTTLSESGHLLFVVAREPSEYDEPPVSGILIVAELRDLETYATAVWHELYPWAFQYLGLDNGQTT